MGQESGQPYFYRAVIWHVLGVIILKNMKQKTEQYQSRIGALKRKKIEQTQQKIEKEGGLDEDDYGRIVPPERFEWNIIPNHENGSFYGYEGWTENFYDLMKNHPVYVDANDAFCGKCMFFLSRMKGPIWKPEFDYSHLKPELEKSVKKIVDLIRTMFENIRIL